MRWIIGIELRHRSTAAVQFARWLSEKTDASWADDFVGVHVLDADHLAAVLRTQHLDEVLDEARAASEEELERESSSDRAMVDVVQALTIAEGLDTARAAHGADGIIVSRIARRESMHILRLGDVGRRLLRRLTCPVIVVPPTFTARSAGTGPIVALTSLGDDSLPACHFAADLASGAGRELAVAHVADEDTSAHAALAQWVDEHEVWPDAAAVLDGDLAEAGLAFAEARRAALLAIGAGPLKGIRRFLGAKLACRLAAVSEIPLLVVPQNYDAARSAVEASVSHATTGPGEMRGDSPRL